MMDKYLTMCVSNIKLGYKGSEYLTNLEIIEIK
jgi:hypothetical protein